MNATLAPADTKTRILDAAERIFSQDGFDAASLRTITAAAQVNLAAVNYHFHSKEALFSAVIERRARPINQRRMELLDSNTGKLTVERILDAFLQPAMENAGHIAAFRPLMARLHSVPLELHQRILKESFAPTLTRFVDALHQAMPRADKADLQVCMFFIIGAMAQTLAWEPIIASFTGKSTVQSAMALLVQFGEAGLKACASTPAPRNSSKRVNH